MEIKCKEPWPKVRFLTENGIERDGYLYYILGDSFYISQNQSGETVGLAENWIINWRNVKFYDKKYGMRCTCGSENPNDPWKSVTHTLVCGLGEGALQTQLL